MSPTPPMLIPSRHDRDRSPRPSLHLRTSSQPSLLNRVRQKLNNLRDKYGFIPKDKLDELLTRETVKEITMQITNLRLGNQTRHLSADALVHEEEYTRIHKNYRVILAILVELSWEEHFFKFHNYDNDDTRLPFTWGQLVHIDDKRIICNLFRKRQYDFIPRTIGEEGRHSWTSEFVLPFIGDYTQNEIGGGGFSKVYKVELYPLYDNIKWTYFNDGQDHVYALKQLEESDENAFMLEAFAGRLLQKRRHSNLLPLLAYFKHGSSLNMIFPYADCDLKTYYETNSPPETATDRLQFMTRIHELTSALKAIHMGGLNQTSELLVLCGYHRDLKPQNILIFNGRFMIADFGLTRFRERNPHDYENTGVTWELGSSTYRAPECDKEGVNVGRAGDVWSLGCILAEVITFVLLGIEGVREFMEYRQKGHKATQSLEKERVPENRRAQDWFHDGNHVKPQVLEWFQYLIDLKNSDRFIAEFIGLLERMLQSNPDGRLKIADVESEFENILRREATKPSAEVSTMATNKTATSAIVPVPRVGRSTIQMVTTERTTTESVSAPYGEPFPLERVTTECETTELVSASVSAHVSASYADSFLSGLRVIIPWRRTDQPATASDERDSSVRQRTVSNVGAPGPLAPHNRTNSAPEPEPRNKTNLGFVHDKMLPSSRYSASPQVIQQGFPNSSTCGPTELQTPHRQSHDRHSMDSILSPKSASRHSGSGTATSGPSRSPSLTQLREVTDPWKPLKFLRRFDTMFLIDDSDVTRTRGWPAMKRSLIRFADLATQYDNDGIDLVFVHSEAEYRGVTSDRLEETMDKVENVVMMGEESATLAMSLDTHLNEYTGKVEEHKNHGPGHKCKYLNLIVLTNRDPGYVDGFDDTVLQYARLLDESHAPIFQLGIQFALIQSKPADLERYKRLDDQKFEGGKKPVRDMVDATPYDPDIDEENVEVLVKVLCGAINPRLDNSEPTAGAFTPHMGSVSTPVSHLFSHYETSAQTDCSPVAPAAATSVLSQNTSEGVVHDGGKSRTKRIGSKARSNPPANYIITPTPPAQFVGDGDEEKGERRPLLHHANGGRACEQPLSHSRTRTAIAVASVACVVLCFLVVI